MKELRTVRDMVAAVRARQVSARELAEAAFARIAADNDRIGAFLTLDRDGALARAAAVDDKIARAVDPGPLGGVPVGIKDILATRDVPTSAGSRILEGWRPPYDATCVKRMVDAGAIPLGKLNMDEFAMGSSNENSAFRVCRNPWDTARVPGGSSGGSAAAVAARMCPVTLGTDTGGSIRQPAALCGVVGMKPTYGRVSRYGLIAFASSLDQVGPLGHTVDDCALVLETIAGHDPLDSTSAEAPVPRFTSAAREEIAGVTVGIPDEYFVGGMDPEVAASVRTAIAELEKQGARVRSIKLPHTEYAVAAYYLVCTAEASSNLARFDGVRYGLRHRDPGDSLLDMYSKTRGEGFGPEVKRRIILGTYCLRSGYYDAYYRKAQQVRALIKQDFDRAFAEVDVIAAPTTPTAAFALGEKVDDPLSMYLADIFTISAPLAGLPAMSVPCGFTKAGLPIGLQLMGRALDESMLFRVGAAYQRATDWHTRVPS